MKKARWGWRKTQAIFASILISSACLGASIPAEAGSRTESLEEMRATIEQLKKTVLALEQKVAIMEEKQEATDTAVQEVVKEDKGSTGGLQLPENTTMSIYGYAKLDVIYTDTDGGGKYFLVPKDIPLNSEQAYLPDNSFIMHARESRIGFTSSTDTSWGKFNTKIEADFYGTEGSQRISNPYNPRLRLAYGELGNLRTGQDWSTFVDAIAYPEVIDFGYPVSRLFVLQPLIRWTQPFTDGSFQFALENPEADFETKTLTDDGMTYVNTTINEKDEYIPDIVARVNLDPQYGHYSVAALARRYSYETDLYNDSTWGAAITANAVLPTFGKDNLRLALSYGTGLGRYMQANFYDAFINPVTHEIETSDQFGGFAAYQHFWLDNLRSTLSYSYAARDNDLNYVTGMANHKYQSVHANLLWSPIPRIDMGMEYIWGYREVEDGEDGDINRVQGGFKYKF